MYFVGCFADAFIALLAIIIIAIFSTIDCICGFCSFDKVGSAEIAETIDNTDKIDKNQLQKFIAVQTSRMKDNLRALYADLFAKKYLMLNVPPVVTLDDIPHQLPYHGSTNVFKTSVHIGQRKLFDSELQFFVDNLAADKQIVCIYAGAAPSNHTGYLSYLFPNVKFILVDPNPFDVFEANPVVLQRRTGDPQMTMERANMLVAEAVAGTEKIYIINDLMTMDIARAAAKNIARDSLYFISDIRTNVTDGLDSPDVIDILWNLSQQYNWMSAMKPRYSMLKFRHPFYNEDPAVFNTKSQQEPYKTDFDLSRGFGIDFAENYKTRKLVYWDGVVNLQAFPGQSSTETRLVTDATGIRDWGTPEEYENKLFYYNSIDRCYCHHFNDNADAELGFDHCNDCAVENLLWKKYIAAYPEVARLMGNSVRAMVAKLSKITHRSLIRENHGRFFEKKYPLAQLIRAAEANMQRPRVQLSLYDVGGQNSQNSQSGKNRENKQNAKKNRAGQTRSGDHLHKAQG